MKHPVLAAEEGSLSTLASRIRALLRADIVRGAFEPASKLTVEHLAQRYGSGPTPVREALNGLVAEGLVTQKDQRGFRVSPVSVHEWKELARTRQWITEIALRESISTGGLPWQEAVVLSFHRMEHIESRIGDTRRALNPEWETAHRAFHVALISGCASRPLIAFYGRLLDGMDRYRHITAAATSGGRDVLSEHRDIMKAAVAQRADEAIKLITAHTQRTTDVLAVVLDAWLQDANSPLADSAKSTRAMGTT